MIHHLISAKRIRQLFRKFGGRKIIVLGDLMLDEYLWGSVNRISPEAPVPVVEVTGSSVKLGGAANVALNLKALGDQPVVVGVIGADDKGKKLVHELERQHLTRRGIIVDRSRPTTTKLRIIAHNQQVVRADRENADEISDAVAGRLLALLSRELAGAAGLVISDYGKGVITASVLRTVIAEAKRRRLFLAVDPKETHFNSYRNVTVITPNHHEAAFAYGKRIRDEKTLEEVGRGLLARLDCESVLITRGDKGMSLFEKNGQVTHIPTVAKKVFDVTGAGDTVISSFAAAYAAGATLREAAFIANVAAGLVVEELGTAQVAKERLLTELLNHSRG